MHNLPHHALSDTKTDRKLGVVAAVEGVPNPCVETENRVESSKMTNRDTDAK